MFGLTLAIYLLSFSPFTAKNEEGAFLVLWLQNLIVIIINAVYVWAGSDFATGFIGLNQAPAPSYKVLEVPASKKQAKQLLMVLE